MARTGRPAKYATIADLEPALRGEIDEAIRSARNESVSSIFRRFGLAQRGLLLRTFANHVRSVRARPVTVDEDERVPEWDELDRWARIEALKRLRAGDAKVYELVLLSRSRREADKLAIEQRAELRAAELHEAKMAEVRKVQGEALEAVSRAIQLTPEQVVELRSKVLGI